MKQDIYEEYIGRHEQMRVPTIKFNLKMYFMKNIFANLILCATGCFLSTVVCTGQRNDKIVPTTPEAAALIKMTEYPISMTSGVPDINIPLFEIKAGNLTLPVAISYHAGGFKINEQSTRAGLGTDLRTADYTNHKRNGRLFQQRLYK